MLIWSDDGTPVDMDSDEDDNYQTMNLGQADLDRLFVATLRAYGVSINVDEVSKFQMNARVAPGLRDDNDTLHRQIELLKSQLKNAESIIERLTKEAPVQSVNGKTGHVVLTRDDLEDFEEGDPVGVGPVLGVQGKIGHVHLTAADFPAPKTSQLLQNIIRTDMRVRHERFGEGTVRGVTNPGRTDATARIDFDDGKSCELLLAVSGLQIIPKAQPQVETLTFDETEHPNEQTPVKLQHLTYLIPEGVLVKRFVPRSLGLLLVNDLQSPLYTDMHILAENPDGSKIDEIVRFVNPRNHARVEQLIADSTPYQTVAVMVKES